jgi:hypothetical protein
MGYDMTLPEAAMWPWRGPGQGRTCLGASGTEWGGGYREPGGGESRWRLCRADGKLVRKQ